MIETSSRIDDIKSKPKSSVHYPIPNSPVTISITNQIYHINEPGLSQDLKQKYQYVRSIIIKELKDKKTHERFLLNFSKEFSALAHNALPDIKDDDVKVLEYYINRDARGFGKIQALFDDPNIEQIDIADPEEILVVHHKSYGLLTCPLTFSKKGLIQLMKKLINRADHKPDINSLPEKIIIRSGISVRINPAKGFGRGPISIIKPSSKILSKNKVETSDEEGVSYSIYHDLINVKITAEKKRMATYRASFLPVSNEEKKLIKVANSQQIKSGPFSNDEFIVFAKKEFPKIPKKRHQLLYSVYIFGQEKFRWMRAISEDQKVFRLLCTNPDKPIIVWHENADMGATTNIIPTRADINRFADFLIKNGGQIPNPKINSYFLPFKSGELISLIRKEKKDGSYFIIDYTRPTEREKLIHWNANQGIESDVVDPLIDELLDRIFSEEYNLTSDFEEEEEKEFSLEKQDDLIDESTQIGINKFKDQMKKLFSSDLLKSKKEKALKGKDEIPYEPPTDDKPEPSNLPAGFTVEDTYWLNRPNSYVIIALDEKRDRHYLVIEPELSIQEMIVLEETNETLRDVLIYDEPTGKDKMFLKFPDVAKVVRSFDPKITPERLSVLYYYLRRNLNGYGKIDSLMYDEFLEDISCNGHSLPVYIHHRLYGSIPTSISFESEELNKYVLKLSQKADKQISLTSPLLDASLPNGSRAQITYSDVVSTKGSSFTIRKFRSDPMTPATLLSFGTYDNRLLALIWLALENRQSLIVVGGTASGKTSAMNAFSFFIPHHSKIVSLEDTREIQIPQKNWLPVQTRATNATSDRGSVDLFDLLKASLRQRPEYIIVGEVRGSEAQTLFQAMNSGHTTLSTLHAGNIEEALNRLTNEPINVPPAMFGALKIMVIQTLHYQEGRMVRRCDAVHELLLGDGDKIKWNTLYEYNPEGDIFTKKYTESSVLKSIQYMHNWSDDEITYQLNLRSEFLARLKKKRISNPERLMLMITDLRRLAIS